MALGLLVLALAWQLAPDCTAFYGSLGTNADVIWWLLHLLLPLISLALALGFFSRVSSMLCWLGVVTVQLGNPHILYGADRLLHLLLFWSIFLPLGTTWSLDARLARKSAPLLPLTDRCATWAIAIQLCLVYWCAALFKSDPLWIQSHDALFYALSIDYLTSPLGLYMRHFPSLLRFLTVATICVEFFGPFLLFIPVYRDRFRFAAVILFIFFQLICMQLLLMVGFFPWVCGAAWLMFVPTFFWDWLIGPLERRPALSSSTRWGTLLDRCAAVLVLISFADVVIWNISSFRGPESEAWMRAHDPFVNVLHLDQRWRMYAPIPHPDHGWLVVPADLADGSQVDLFTSGPVSWATPPDIGAYLGKDRWRIYLGDIMYRQDPKMLSQFGDYLVNTWNESHPEKQKVRTLSIVFMKQSTLPNLTISPAVPVTLYTKKFGD